MLITLKAYTLRTEEKTYNADLVNKSKMNRKKLLYQKPSESRQAVSKTDIETDR